MHNNEKDFWLHRSSQKLDTHGTTWKYYGYYLQLGYAKLFEKVDDYCASRPKGTQLRALKTDIWDIVVEEERSLYEILPHALREMLTMMDLSGPLTFLAKRKFPEHSVVQADIKKQPFRNSVFDVVLDCSTIDHLDEKHVGAALDEYLRILSDGGLLVLVYTRNSFPIRVASLLLRLLRKNVYAYYQNRYSQYFFEDELISAHLEKSRSIKTVEDIYFGGVLHLPSKSIPVKVLLNLFPKRLWTFLSGLEFNESLSHLFREVSLLRAIVLQKHNP
jgi:SAM-dependent methyltransferase